MKRQLAALALLSLAGCQNAQTPAAAVPPTAGVGPSLNQIPGHDYVNQDTTTKESPRLVPAEAYIRTYLQLFGGLSPLQVQQQFAGGNNNGLFDSWNAYLGALGLPRYEQDLPRRMESNAIMIATFERLGIALCDKSVEHDIQAAPPMAQRTIFTFDIPAGDLDVTAFTPLFDRLHRTFLGYPAALAPTDRTNRFFALYQQTVAGHDPAKTMMKSKFTPQQAGWAAVCYGLVRHPEFQVY
jgi:hypothetical protein